VIGSVFCILAASASVTHVPKVVGFPPCHPSRAVEVVVWYCLARFCYEVSKTHCL